MELDAPVREFLAVKPDAGSPAASTSERRAAILAASDRLFDQFGEPAEDVASMTRHEVATGDSCVRVAVYRPSSATGLPLHVFFHGGGFWLGSIDERVVD